MTKKAKPGVTNVHITGTSKEGPMALCCEFEGLRYHVWLNPKTLEPSKDGIMFKNPPLEIKYREPGHFDTRKLALSGPSAQKVYPAMRAALIDGELVKKWHAKLDAAEAVAQRSNEAEMAERRIKEAAPVLLAALLEARARLLVVYPAGAAPIQKIDAALLEAGVTPEEKPV